MQGANDGRAGIGSHLFQSALQPLAGRSESAKWIVDANAPVGAGDELAGNGGGTLRQSGLVQPECKLDDVRDAFVRAFALFIFEGIGIAACGKETLLEMVLANDAEMLWGNWLRIFAHRRQQLRDALARA